MGLENVDARQVFKMFESLDFKSSKKVKIVRGALRKAGNIIKQGVRKEIPNETDNSPFRHISIIKKSLKVITDKDKENAGVNVYVKGPSVPVGTGKNLRWWPLWKYTKLVLEGNYQTRPRRKRSTKKETGNVKGIAPGNVFERVEKRDGQKALNAAVNDLIPQIEKEILRIKI